MKWWLIAGIGLLVLPILLSVFLPSVIAQQSCVLGIQLCYSPGTQGCPSDAKPNTGGECYVIRNEAGSLSGNGVMTVDLRRIKQSIPPQSEEGWYYVHAYCNPLINDALWAFCLDHDKSPEEFCKASFFEDKIPDWYKGAPGCCGDDNECMSFTGSNLCTEVKDKAWLWLNDKYRGQVFRSKCGNPSTFVVGDKYYACGGNYTSDNNLFVPLSVTSITKDIILGDTTAQRTHDYLCYSKGYQKILAECRGNQDAFSGNSAVEEKSPTAEVAVTGTKVNSVQGTANQTYYCTASGRWVPDLDLTDKPTCEKSGFQWTGTKCCSEQDDPQEYYNEPNTPVGDLPLWGNPTGTLPVVLISSDTNTAVIFSSNKTNASNISTSPNSSTPPNTTLPGLTVAIREFSFNPSVITVFTGQTIMWTNEDAVTHSLVLDAGIVPIELTGKLASKQSTQPTDISKLITKPGTYQYHCSIHPNIKGSITLKQQQTTGLSGAATTLVPTASGAATGALLAGITSSQVEYAERIISALSSTFTRLRELITSDFTAITGAQTASITASTGVTTECTQVITCGSDGKIYPNSCLPSGVGAVDCRLDQVPSSNITVTGGCWNKTYVPIGGFAPKLTRTTVVNAGGRFYGCNLNSTDPALLLKDYHTQQLLVQNMPFCTGFADVKPTDKTPNVFCAYTGEWLRDQENRNKNSSVPWTEPEENGLPAGWKPQECCFATSCWTGTKCQKNQLGDASPNPTYPEAEPDNWRCINGTWRQEPPKSTPDGSEFGYCSRADQCLVDSNGQAQFDGDVDRIFRSNKTTERPQCINNTQFYLDNYCGNGEWTSRTKLIAEQLLAIPNANTTYSLYCDDYQHVLAWYGYLVQGRALEDYLGTKCKIAGSGGNPCVNNLCVLKHGTQVSFGFSTNIPIGQPTGILRGLSQSNNSCNGAMNNDADFDKCGDTQIWYNYDTQSIIYTTSALPSPSAASREKITIPFTELTRFAADKRRQGVTDDATMAMFKDFFPTTRMFRRLYLSASNSETSTGPKPVKIFSFLESRQRRPPGSGTAPTLDWLGFKAEGTALGDFCDKEPNPGLLAVYDDKAYCSQADDKYLIIRAQEVNSQTGEAAALPGSQLITNYPNIAGKLRPT